MTGEFDAEETPTSKAEALCGQLCDAILVIDELERAAAVAMIGTMVVEFCGYEMSRLGPKGSANALFIAAAEIDLSFQSLSRGHPIAGALT